MLINRWKKDKDKDKSNATSTSASQNASGSGSSSGGSGFFANSSSNSKSSTLGSAVKKKRKSGKDAEEDWNPDSKNKAPTNDQTGAKADEEMRKGRSNRREDPRRHTLSGDHHSAATAAAAFNYQNNIAIDRSLDLEMGMKNQRKKSPSSRGYPPISNSTLFDDDPGIMSEVETSSTGFRRGNKQRSSLPVVRTPSKTLERPLGLVFLQYRNETKRSLLPNEITSLDTVKALFVRSFPKQLTMEYLDSPRVKIYIHDSNKDMFYELEDLRSHLNEIRDRSVLRLFESADTGDGTFPAGLSVPVQMWNDPDQSYFSEPEFDSEFQHQHIHKSKTTKSNLAHQPYYMTHSFPPGSSATLPRGGSVMRPFSPAVPIGAAVISKSAHTGFSSSPERGAASGRVYSPYGRNFLDDAYYSQYSSRASSITPIIDEETSDTELLEDGYGLYSGVKLPAATATAAATNRSAPFPLGSSTPVTVPPLDATRLRVEHMERQLANLTGLVQKALTQTVPTSSPRDRDTTHSSDLGSFPSVDSKPPKLSRDKSVSFEKSVSFSDDPPEMNSPKQHSPQHTDSKPTKPAIKSSTLPRTSSQERERLKPAPPPKPSSLSTAAVTYDGRPFYKDLQLTPELYNQLRGLQKKARDLRHELRTLRRMSQAQAHSVKESVRDTFVKIRSMVLSGGESLWTGGADSERIRITREEEIYKEDINRLEDDLTELESTVEELRSNVINRKTRVNMIDVENMALILSKSSKTVADLKLKFPLLQGAMKSVMSLEMQRVIAEENFLKDEPDRLESALRRCKKLTGTLVTLKRLASVQEQRLPDNQASPTLDEAPVTPTSGKVDGDGTAVACSGVVSAVAGSRGCAGTECGAYAANTFDSLLEELQTTAKAEGPGIASHNGMATGAADGAGSVATLRRLHSFPSDAKPPVPERLGDLAAKRVPPPPPPRTSSKSPLASPTNPVAPVPRRSPTRKGSLGSASNGLAIGCLEGQPSPSTSSSCESINSQEGLQNRPGHLRQEQLELRHQELLKKQRALQEQYSRLQQLQQTPPPDLLQLKKTGSEGNIFSKMGMTFGPAATGSTTNVDTLVGSQRDLLNPEAKTKVYETDIL